MVGYDFADPRDPGTLVVPFIFVPHGHPPPLEWMAAHPGWIRVSATLVPREPARGENGLQWNVQVSQAARADSGIGAGGLALTAGRQTQAVLADPAGPAGIRRAAAEQPVEAHDQGRNFAGIAQALLGIGTAQAQVREEEEVRRRGPGGRELSIAEEMRLDRFNLATRRLRELEPNNRQLESISDPNHVPNEAWVEEIEKEVRAAVTRHNVPLAVPERRTLADDRRTYILDGVGKGGGGHGPGRKTPRKSEFPSDWSDDKTISVIEDVANDPASVRGPAFNGRTFAEGTREGVSTRVIVGRDGKTIVTAYPTNIPRNRE